MKNAKDELFAKYADKIAPEDMRILRELCGSIDGKPTVGRGKLADMLWKAIGHILDCEHYGHRLYCGAINGPDGEHWYEDDKCNCTRRKALDDLYTVHKWLLNQAET